MMSQTTRHLEAARRGLTLIELTISLSITAVVAMAISGTMAAVNIGIHSRRDARTVMVRSSAAHARLGAYINSSRAILQVEPHQLVIWLNDDREGNTVHASEIRWIAYDADDRTVSVYFVQFPEGWTQTMRELVDKEYKATQDWDNAFTTYDTLGYMHSVVLVDGLDTFAFETDAAQAINARHVSFELGIEHETGAIDMVFGATVRNHKTPDH